MNAFTEFINALPNFIGVFLLMLSTFLIGYFSAVGMQRNKFRKIIERLKREVNALKVPPKKDVRDIDTIFTEIEPKIIAAVKKQHEKLTEHDEEAARIENISFAEKNKERYLNQISETTDETDDDVRELDFDSFGYADATDKEDLTKINGIGPYIEQKLNDIGIYTFEQVSKLSAKDIDIITEMIDFFPDRIDRDNWVGQAQALNV